MIVYIDSMMRHVLSVYNKYDVMLCRCIWNMIYACVRTHLSSCRCIRISYVCI